MTPGRTFIRKCSRCSKPISQRTVKSGNTFGAIWWTDGWYRAAMLPDQPRLVACPHCHATLWIDELEKLGVLDNATIQAGEFAEVLPYLSLSHEDYLVLISEGAATRDKERYARLRAWWAGNDRRRRGVAEIPLTPAEASNLTAVAQLLDESVANDLVMKAEVLRELGRFADASALFARMAEGVNQRVAAIIRRLVDECDPYVRRLPN